MNRTTIIIGIAALLTFTGAQAITAQDAVVSFSDLSPYSERIGSELVARSSSTLQDDSVPAQPATQEQILRDDTDKLYYELTQKQQVEREFGEWPRKELQEIKIDIRSSDLVLPRDRSAQLLNANETPWSSFRPTSKVFAWAAPDIRYQPLYFEDVALERYGQTLSPYKQSMASSIHFFKSLVTLPNQMRHDCPSSCDYPLGFCRPGNSAPCIYQHQYFGFLVR